MQRYRDWLDDIEATEDAELDDLLAEAEASDDERRKEVTRGLVDQKKMQRDLMSERIGERLGEYQDYEFVSSEAREQFEQLMAELERDVLNTYFEKSKEMMGRPDPEELARMRDMMDALSTMIEQDRRGKTSIRPSMNSWRSSVTSFPARRTSRTWCA